MARRVDGRERHARARHPLAVVEAVEQLGRAHVEAGLLEVLPEAAAGADGVEQHVQVVIVNSHRHRMVLGVHDRADAADVVDVAVGAEQGDQAQAVVLKPGNDGGWIGRRVDQHALAPRPRGRHDPGVGLGQPQRQSLDHQRHGREAMGCGRVC